MKILLVNVVFGSGSTGTIVSSLFLQYQKLGHEVYAVYGRGKKSKEANITKIGFEFESKINHFFSRISGNLYGGCYPLGMHKFKKIYKSFKPDIVHIHCVNGFFINVYKVLHFLKKEGVKTIITNHADFMFTANCGYSLECDKWKNAECRKCKRIHEFNGKLSLNRTHHFYKKMLEAIDGFNGLKTTCVSPWLSQRIETSPIYKNVPNKTVLNGLDVSCFTRKTDDNPFEDLLKIHNKKRVALFVCNNSKNVEKGFAFFKKLSEEMVDSDWLFVHIGKKTNGDHFVNLDSICNSDLPIYYSFADVTLLFSMRETFSMIVAESLCCGTPVYGFRSGGPETIAIEKFTRFVEYGQLDEIKKLMNDYQLADRDVLSKEAKEKYANEVSARNYLGVFKDE